MATSNRFTKCTDPNDVDVELKKLLCCEYLHEQSCKDNFGNFRLSCWIHLTTPYEKQLSNPADIIEKLRAKDIIRVGDYGKLKDLVKDIDVDMVTLIEEAEERIRTLDVPNPKRQKIGTESFEDVPNPKRQKIGTESFEGDEQSIKNLRERLIKINNDKTRVIPLSPLLERGEDELPIEKLYAQVDIQEDPKYMEKGHGSSHSTKEVMDPDDIFTKDGDAVKKIFMTGDSGRGKTTFCLWLLKNWCNALQKDCSDSKKLDKWEKKLKEFDFVFLLQLCDFQYIQTNIASVIDMICQVVFESDTDHHATIRHVLSSNQYRSLIIIDGLDEWNPNEETSKHLIYERMPKLDVSSTVSCFIAMRPWVLSTISKTVRNSDRVIEVFGLNEAGIEIVIKNVLVNRYKLEKNSKECIYECNKIFRHFSEKKLKSFMQIPLLTVVCVQKIYEKKQLGDSMTSFYAEMLNMLIERANEKHIKLQEGQSSGSECDVPRVFCKHKKIQNYISVLLKLGELAYEGLISDKTSKVFEKIELGDEIRYFALNAGIISQKEASSRTEKKVSVHFFHKSIQEFLAVIYIVTNKEVSDSFRKHLSSVKVIMELSNVIMFICGMCPTLGSVISQHVISVTDSDIDICTCRESPGINNPTVEKLYELQVIWYSELQCGQIESPMVSDIYLKSTSSIETVMGTRELLHGASVNIKSLFLWWVPIDEKSGITNAQLNNFLGNKDKTKSLTKVIICGGNGRTFHPISQPTHLRYLYLYNLAISKSDHYGNSCPQLLKDMPLLRELDLYDVTLNEKGLYLSADMVHLKTVRLESVNMSAALWQNFMLSVLNIQHRFNVKLWDTNIDDESKSKIRSSVDFSVTQDGFVKNEMDIFDEYKYKLNFTRVWPLSHTTRYDDDGNEILYTKL